MTFEEYIEQLNLRYFRPEEFLTKTERRFNRVPPKKLWPNIVPTAIILDCLRAETKKPIVINSCYRAPEYNARLRGSARRSQHCAFTAVDISSPLGSSVIFQILSEYRGYTLTYPEAVMPLKRVQAKVGLFEKKFNYATGKWLVNRVNSGVAVPYKELVATDPSRPDRVVFRGGLGLYERFVHLDTRGLNATWGLS